MTKCHNCYEPHSIYHLNKKVVDNEVKLLCFDCISETEEYKTESFLDLFEYFIGNEKKISKMIKYDALVSASIEARIDIQKGYELATKNNLI